MIDKWTNFAIYHNPTPIDNAWPPYGTNGITYVRLEDSKLIVKNDKVRDERLPGKEVIVRLLIFFSSVFEISSTGDVGDWWGDFLGRFELCLSEEQDGWFKQAHSGKMPSRNNTFLRR